MCITYVCMYVYVLHILYKCVIYCICICVAVFACACPCIHTNPSIKPMSSKYMINI